MTLFVIHVENDKDSNNWTKKKIIQHTALLFLSYLSYKTIFQMNYLPLLLITVRCFSSFSEKRDFGICLGVYNKWVLEG